MRKVKPLIASHLDEQIGFQLRLAQLAVFNDIIESLKSLDLRPADLSALLLIDANPGLRQHVIGDVLKIARPNIVSLIDSLAKRGLVERVIDSKDRRANQLVLTEAGKSLLEKGVEVQEMHRTRMLTALEGIDIAMFMDGLRQLAAIDRS